jgi:hypothetical protein
MSLQEAQQVWQRWELAQNSSSSSDDADWLAALRGLAPKWQQPPGLKKLNTKQQAGVDQLRGLVQLATAAATLGQPPKDILEVSFALAVDILKASGLLDVALQGVTACPFTVLVA